MLKVGDTIWRFDHNHRVYRPLKPGEPPYASRGAPIYREYWVPTKITGETRVSWETCYGKVPKNGKDRRRKGWCFTQEEVDHDVWIDAYRYRIERAVLYALARRFDHGYYERVQAIAKAIDFKPEEWKE